MNFLFRTARPFRGVNSWLTLYTSLVRSILEYCSPVWSPFYAVHVDRLESIQRRFVRFLCARAGVRRLIPDYSDRLLRFGLASLADRRRLSGICVLHRVVGGHMGSDLLARVHIRAPLRSVRHPCLFMIPRARSEVSRNSPLARICRDYNGLLCRAVDIFTCSDRSLKEAFFNML
jgi:hypothetical protein